MSTLWSDHIAGLIPYVPGEQARIPNLLKLNTNENPYGPSPKAIAAMRAALGDDLRLYPDPHGTALRRVIARRYRLEPDQVFLGNGSDEVLAHVFNAFFLRGGRPLWLPDITYSFYRTYCRFFEVPHRLIPLAGDFTLRLQDYTEAADQEPVGIIFANPNAPTGCVLDLDAIRQITLAHPDSTVVVDEAYVDFGAQSAAVLIRELPNILVVHTLSKSRALAGLRVGYAMGSPDLIAGLVRVKDSFNSYPLDRVALAGAQAAIEDEDWFDQSCQAVVNARESLAQKLRSLGFTVLPSLTNFLFVTHRTQEAADIARKLRDEGILVRHFQAPRIDQYLRITVGTPEQCTRLCDTLKSILAAA
ncbi:histidinol-phosphate transaminase [Castellaniella sp.]|uniref:histidinol-phosphate transaminase n=1 Tax=Castellaniella sp. TaxID=1955812 RepID=UPI002AFF83BE|nr:histidinol-phosphate transaminase [Castellaniella sp.]